MVGTCLFVVQVARARRAAARSVGRVACVCLSCLTFYHRDNGFRVPSDSAPLGALLLLLLLLTKSLISNPLQQISWRIWRTWRIPMVKQRNLPEAPIIILARMLGRLPRVCGVSRSGRRSSAILPCFVPLPIHKGPSTSHHPGRKCA